VVLEKRGVRVYYHGVHCGLNFLSVLRFDVRAHGVQA